MALALALALTLTLTLALALISPVPLFSTPPFFVSLFLIAHTYIHLNTLYQQFVFCSSHISYVVSTLFTTRTRIGQAQATRSSHVIHLHLSQRIPDPESACKSIP